MHRSIPSIRCGDKTLIKTFLNAITNEVIAEWLITDQWSPPREPYLRCLHFVCLLNSIQGIPMQFKLQTTNTVALTVNESKSETQWRIETIDCNKAIIANNVGMNAINRRQSASLSVVWVHCWALLRSISATKRSQNRLMSFPFHSIYLYSFESRTKIHFVCEIFRN